MDTEPTAEKVTALPRMKTHAVDLPVGLFERFALVARANHRSTVGHIRAVMETACDEHEAKTAGRRVAA